MEFCSFQRIASSIQSVYEYISVMKPLISGAFCISISRMPLIYRAYYVDFNGTTIDIDVQHSHQHDTLYNDRNLIYNNHGRSKWHRHCTNIKHWKKKHRQETGKEAIGDIFKSYDLVHKIITITVPTQPTTCHMSHKPGGPAQNTAMSCVTEGKRPANWCHAQPALAAQWLCKRIWNYLFRKLYTFKNQKSPFLPPNCTCASLTFCGQACGPEDQKVEGSWSHQECLAQLPWCKLMPPEVHCWPPEAHWVQHPLPCTQKLPPLSHLCCPPEYPWTAPHVQ